jgi:hypothetical protein
MRPPRKPALSERRHRSTLLLPATSDEGPKTFHLSEPAQGAKAWALEGTLGPEAVAEASV